MRKIVVVCSLSVIAMARAISCELQRARVVEVYQGFGRKGKCEKSAPQVSDSGNGDGDRCQP